MEAPQGVVFAHADEVDETTLRHVDDELRQFVYGTNGWQRDEADFEEHSAHCASHDRLQVDDDRLYFPHMGRLAVILFAMAMTVTAGGVFTAHGGVTSRAGHGPGQGGFSAFAVNPRNPQIVYAGSGSGIFKSIDSGRTWQATNAGLTEQYVFDLVIDQRHPTTLYAATGSGVFKTTDAGRSWRATTMPSITTIALALHPRNAQLLYASTNDGVFKSGDAGASWQKVMTARRVFTLAVNPRQPETVYAGSGGGVFKTTDGGHSWEARNVGLFPNETPDSHSLVEGFVSAVVVNPRRPRTLYLGCTRGVFKSTDGGRTWRRVKGGSVGSLVIDPDSPETLYTGTYESHGLFKTTNGGRRWSAIGPSRKGNVLALALDPTNSRTVYVGMFEGAKAFRSLDGGRSWGALSIPVS